MKAKPEEQCNAILTSRLALHRDEKCTLRKIAAMEPRKLSRFLAHHAHHRPPNMERCPMHAWEAVKD